MRNVWPALMKYSFTMWLNAVYLYGAAAPLRHLGHTTSCPVLLDSTTSSLVSNKTRILERSLLSSTAGTSFFKRPIHWV